MTGGWAATNTLRAQIELLDRVDEYAANETTDSGLVDLLCNAAEVPSGDAALALVENALDAAETIVDRAADPAIRVEEWKPIHSDDIAALAAALRAVREGT